MNLTVTTAVWVCVKIAARAGAKPSGVGSPLDRAKQLGDDTLAQGEIDRHRGLGNLRRLRQRRKHDGVPVQERIGIMADEAKSADVLAGDVNLDTAQLSDVG